MDINNFNWSKRKMTKEEAVDLIINDYKNGNQSAMSDYCDRVRCVDCPFDSDDCVNDAHNILIERLIKAEEHQETNLEHYVAYYNNYDQCIYMDAVKLTNESHRRLNNFEDAIEWLLEPYKPPKPKYKLSKFEYDLLQVSVNKWERILNYTITDSDTLEKMADRGYFKNIPLTIPIKDILGNCEVVD